MIDEIACAVVDNEFIKPGKGQRSIASDPQRVPGG
jgi:translation elongation factor P/translation initiation factor 5A